MVIVFVIGVVVVVGVVIASVVVVVSVIYTITKYLEIWGYKVMVSVNIYVYDYFIWLDNIKLFKTRLNYGVSDHPKAVSEPIKF